jgi:hypothetical protein
VAQKIITIDIDKEAGTFSVDTAGFQGTGCQGIHDAFAKMGKVTKEVKKPEYYAKPNGNTVSTGR